MQAAAQLQVIDGRPVEWAWIGMGEDLAGLRNQTAVRRLADRVFWLGERDDPRPYLRAADLLVLPSRIESAGLVVLEAAKEGTPTVAFGVGGVPELIRDPRALAESGNVADLTQKIVAVLLEPMLSDALLSASAGVLQQAEAGAWRSRLTAAVEVCLSR
jgi:glycosyltransferase involved in cell wall biosynthesis